MIYYLRGSIIEKREILLKKLKKCKIIKEGDYSTIYRLNNAEVLKKFDDYYIRRFDMTSMSLEKRILSAL